MKRINIVLVGAGNISKTHVMAIENVREARLVGVLSLSRKNKIDILLSKGLKNYKSYQEVLASKNVDAVDIVSANYLHASLGVEAARHKKHVLVEKPIAVSILEASKLILACKKNKVKLSVMFQNRFSPRYINFRARIKNNELGKIRTGFCSWLMNKPKEYYESSVWRKNKRKSGGGVLMMNMIHYIDWLQWSLGPVESVRGYVNNQYHKYEVEDEVHALLKFKNRAEITIYGTTSANYRSHPAIRIIGLKDECMIEDRDYEIGSSELFSKLIKDFCLSILNNRKPLVGGESAVETLKIVLAIYKSAKLGQEFFLNKI
ncbi:MAG: Gfo/Idh/MocA family oxidoreductase [Candidatus Gastranaerophilaceae bacterium]|jgi:predicted dehydrogenase